MRARGVAREVYGILFCHLRPVYGSCSTLVAAERANQISDLWHYSEGWMVGRSAVSSNELEEKEGMESEAQLRRAVLSLAN